MGIRIIKNLIKIVRDFVCVYLQSGLSRAKTSQQQEENLITIFDIFSLKKFN